MPPETPTRLIKGPLLCLKASGRVMRFCLLISSPMSWRTCARSEIPHKRAWQAVQYHVKSRPASHAPSKSWNRQAVVICPTLPFKWHCLGTPWHFCLASIADMHSLLSVLTETIVRNGYGFALRFLCWGWARCVLGWVACAGLGLLLQGSDCGCVWRYLVVACPGGRSLWFGRHMTQGRSGRDG